jgi:hypothetical protein
MNRLKKVSPTMLTVTGCWWPQLWLWYMEPIWMEYCQWDPMEPHILHWIWCLPLVTQAISPAPNTSLRILLLFKLIPPYQQFPFLSSAGQCHPMNMFSENQNIIRQTRTSAVRNPHWKLQTHQESCSCHLWWPLTYFDIVKSRLPEQLVSCEGDGV